MTSFSLLWLLSHNDKSHNYEIIIMIRLNWWKWSSLKVCPLTVFFFYLPVTTHISSGPLRKFLTLRGSLFHYKRKEIVFSDVSKMSDGTISWINSKKYCWSVIIHTSKYINTRSGLKRALNFQLQSFPGNNAKFANRKVSKEDENMRG